MAVAVEDTMHRLRFYGILALISCAIISRPLEGSERDGVTITVVARKAVWKQDEPCFFDVTVKNSTDASIEVPYIYDAVLEIDGKLYTQFPKPIVSEEPNRTFAARSTESHGSVTLNGAFDTVDAKTGKTPLKLEPGRHTLVVKLGAYQSQKVSFKIAD